MMEYLNAAVETIRNIDPGVVMMTLGLCVCWSVFGFQLCKLRHKKHGIETDSRLPQLAPDPVGSLDR